MPGKRKRTDGANPQIQMPDTTTTTGKPLSAIAAARLRAEATAKGIVSPEITIDPVPEPPRSSPHIPTRELEAAEPDEEPLIISRNLKLCSWRHEPQNVLSDTASGLVVKLSKHTTISLVGSYRFKILRGAININGANIGVLSRDGQKDHVYTSYAPATHPISKIRGLDSVNHVHFTSCEGPTVLTATSPLFAGIWNVQTGTEINRSFTIITEPDADPLARPLSPETTTEEWLRAIEDCATSPSIIVTIGSANSGKSTFARRLLNRYLTGQGKSARPVPAVCYLDLDPEKTEYTPHGQVSLNVVRSLNLGPNFTQLSMPVSSPDAKGNEVFRSHPVPANLVNHREYYCACAEDLFLSYKSLQSRDPLLPLIITTPGSLYDSDFDILVSLLARFKPHHSVHLGDIQAVDIESATKLHSLQIVVSQYRGTIHKVTSQSPISAAIRTEAELKAMQMQSYFHLKGTSTSKANTLIWSPTPLTRLVPWEFCFEERNERTQDFVGFAMYSEPIEPVSLLQALNGSIVQIIESASSAVPSPYTSLSRTNRHRIPYFAKSDRIGMVEPLDPKTSKLICTALVRQIDPERKVIQLLVPTTHETLLYTLSPKRTVLVGGCCDTPEWAYLEDSDAMEEVVGVRSNEAAWMPWVEESALMDSMGYMNTVRRVRKFQT